MREEKLEIKIFTTQRPTEPSVVPACDIFVPVCAGAALLKEQPDITGDNTGENISTKNKSYCELTTQYWAWKNVKADLYGFCHYRRYFSFAPKKLVEDIHGAVNFSYFDEDAIEAQYLEDEATIYSRVEPYDFLIGSPADLRKVNLSTLYDQYDAVPHLNVDDLHCAIDVLKELYPEYSDSADTYMNGHIFYPCNMFIMRKELFDDYNTWLFSILAETEKRIDMSNYSVEGLRTPGHIAERLLGIYYTYLKEHYPQYRLSVIQRTIIWNTDKTELPRPKFETKNVPVIFSCSDFFVPYVAGTLQSLVDHTTDEHNYDLIFLHTGIEKYNQKLLLSMVSGKENISIRFINIASIVQAHHFIANNHVSVETFYRLFANQLLKYYEKIVYLDSDLILLRDVAELYEIDLGNHLLAATVDADHAGEYCGAIPGTKKYCDKVLKLKDPFQYFQAGVMVFNIRELNRRFKPNELIEYAEKQEYMYVDQDVLNVKCEGRVHFLDMRWNVMTDCNRFRMDGIIKKAPKSIYDTYMESRKDPYIIHYAGVEKPWNSPVSDFADIYWSYIRKTPFYEAVLWRMSDVAATSRFSVCAPSQGSLSQGSFMRRIADIFCPKGTRRREWFKRIYYRMH